MGQSRGRLRSLLDDPNLKPIKQGPKSNLNLVLGERQAHIYIWQWNNAKELHSVFSSCKCDRSVHYLLVVWVWQEESYANAMQPTSAGVFYELGLPEWGQLQLDYVS